MLPSKALLSTCSRLISRAAAARLAAAAAAAATVAMIAAANIFKRDLFNKRRLILLFDNFKQKTPQLPDSSK